MELVFKPFSESDIAIFSPMMKRAFDRDSQLHLNKSVGGPEGYDDGSFLKKWFLHPRATAYAVFDGRTPIGGVNLWLKADGSGFLGCLFVDSHHEDKGYGTAIWKAIEQTHPEIKLWQTETPSFAFRNYHFYINKCGFRCIAIKDPKNREKSSYLLEKRIGDIKGGTL